MQEVEHPIFTDFTWADLGPRGLTRTHQLGWDRRHDLAVEAYETAKEYCSLSFAEWRDLISATASGLPIRLTYRGRTSTCIVDQILTLSGGTTANLYMRTWGFSFPLALDELEAVEVPSTEYH